MTKRNKDAVVLPTSSTPHWTQVLVAALSARLAQCVQSMRAELRSDPLLKGVLITDAEVDALLAQVSETSAAPSYTPGSLTIALARDAAASAGPWLALQSRFGLSDFEMDVLAVCLGAHIEPRLARAFAYLNDDVSLRHPSAQTVLRLTAPGRLDLRGALARDGRLLRLGLLVMPDAARPQLLSLAEGVVRFVLEQDGVDPLLSRVWCDDDAAPLAARLWQTRAELSELQALFESQLKAQGGAPPLVLNLIGRAGSGRRYLTETACKQAGLGCLSLDARKLRRSGEPERILTAALRDAVLLSAPLLLHRCDEDFDDSKRSNELAAWLQPLVRELGWCVVLTSETPLGAAAWFPAARVVEMTLPPLTVAEREAAWHTVLQEFPVLPSEAREDSEAREELAAPLAAKFRLTHGEIALVAQRLHNLPTGPQTAEQWSVATHAIAGTVAAPKLHQLAQLIDAQHELTDLVLPADRLESLNEVVRRTRHRRTVLEDWVFESVSSRGRGLIVLFYGAAGTGKSMAAEALARALRMQLFRIDLAGVVSKYIGETEKNLRAVFEEADRADAVLFFDEADALFGKRSEVKDAHDRYANIEINYLLQRIESFEGIAILATNMRASLDEAFLRRIHITVEFPLPHLTERLGLWDRAFPQGAPLTDDIDWQFLAQRFELTGGAIRNAALGAAYLAAAREGVIGMTEVINALRAELIKAGRRVSDGDFGAYAPLLITPTVMPRVTRLMRRSGATSDSESLTV